MIVALKHVKKAAIALLKEFPFLEEDEQEVVVRLQDVATHDVLIDLMKPMKPHLRAIFKNAKAVRALSIAFPHLEPEDAEVAVRLRDKESNEVAIDVMNPLQPPNHVIFKYTKKVTAGKESYRVPTLEIQGGIGTVIWPNGANFAPEALYEIDERPSAQPESVARRRKMGA